MYDIKHLGGKELEQLVIDRKDYDEPAGLYTLSRYGVQGVFMNNEWRPVQSYPDFEGITPDGHQFIFDSKVSSQGSFDLTGGTSKSFRALQYKHLCRRARFNVTTFILLHFNERVMKKGIEQAFTVAIPVGAGIPFWEDYDRGEAKGISRSQAMLIGVPVVWNLATQRCKQLTPDIGAAVAELRNNNALQGVKCISSLISH